MNLELIASRHSSLHFSTSLFHKNNEKIEKKSSFFEQEPNEGKRADKITRFYLKNT